MILLRNVEVGGHSVDVRIEGERIAAVGPGLGSAFGSAGLEIIDGYGGALLPGLHDHHVHLLAMAAARRSFVVGPAGLAATLSNADRSLPAGEWIRAVGSADDDLDRARLDAIVPDRPVRVQHRSGAMWVLNSAALAVVGVGGDGRLFRQDEWLRERIPSGDGIVAALADVGRELALYGITGVTDMTPFERLDRFSSLADAALPLDVTVTGGPALTDTDVPAGLERGPVKIVLADHALPDPADIAAAVSLAHRAGRPVAVHCVTRAALALLLAAWSDADGSAMAGDRVEHGAVVPPDMATQLADLGVTVVTQPGFVRERGDDYVRDVDPDDVSWLYPCASLLTAGVRVGGSSDAPFASADPWAAIETAITRRTTGGHVLGPGERVTPERALALFLSPADDPGGPPRRIEPGGPASVCLLDRPLAAALAQPSADCVVSTIHRGRISYRR